MASTTPAPTSAPSTTTPPPVALASTGTTAPASLASGGTTAPVAGAPTSTETPPKGRAAEPFVKALEKERQLQATRRAIAQEQANARAEIAREREAFGKERETVQQERTRLAEEAKQYGAWRAATELAKKNPRAYLDAGGVDRQQLLAMLTEEALTGAAPDLPVDARVAELEQKYKKDIEEVRAEQERRWTEAKKAEQEQAAQQKAAVQREAEQQIAEHRERVRRFAESSAAKYELVAASGDDAVALMNEYIEAAAMQGHGVPSFEEAAEAAEQMIAEDAQRLMGTARGRDLALQIAKAAGWGPAPEAPPAALPASAPAPAAPRTRPVATLSSRELPASTPAAPVVGQQRNQDDRLARAVAKYNDTHAARQRLAGG